MAVLTAAWRTQCRQDWTEQLMAAGETIGITKADLQAAINATDAWIAANAASFNVAIPQPARNALSAKQKARLIMAVAKRRYEVT